MEGKNVDHRVVVDEGGIQRVLYSMHSSLEEIQDFVKILQPYKVTPIAKPNKVSKEKVFINPTVEISIKLNPLNFLFSRYNSF